MDTFLTSSSSSSSSLTTNNGALGSSFLNLKHARSGNDLETADLGYQKVARMTTEQSKYSSSCRSLFPGGTQMLSFSSPGKECASALSADHAATLSSYQQHHHHSSQPSDLQSSYFGYGGGASLNNGAMSRIRGPFTPSQWMELEHQALIYKYIVANAPVPTTLLIAIRRSLAPAALSPFASFASNPMEWSSLHLAYAGSTDPEPGRCRRTDGKKWRCSRDAVPDQKYCERHINRGRHRSRKHVEGRNANAGQAPIRPAPAPVTNGGGSGAAARASSEHLNRNLLSEPSTTNTHKSQSLSLLTSTNQNTVEGSFHSGNRPENLFQAANRWTQIEESQSNATQLSIAIPVAPSNFSSSSSPSHDNLTIAPLALMSHNFNDTVPESWESSVGGPLGEVLNSSNTNYASTDQHNNCVSLNLSADSWDLCPNLNSSPTGVLQKNNFGSVSSSNASSPRPDNAVFFSDQPITLL